MSLKSNKIVSVIIVTAGNYEYLAGCLDSLKLQSFSPFEIFVIDNAPGKDGLVPDCVERAAAQYYASPKNLYYGKALNIGLGKTSGDFVLCLNDDVVLDKYFIERALEGFEKNRKIGMVGAKVMRSNRCTVDSIGLSLTYCRSAREKGYGCMDAQHFNRQGYIFGPTGAVAFFSRKMLEELKEKEDYFDPAFDMFYEDVDIVWRAQNKGWKAFYIPEAIAFHLRGGSARLGPKRHRGFARESLNDELYAELIKNRYLAIIKNESLPGFLLHLPGIFVYDLFAWGACLFSRPRAAVLFLKKLGSLKAAFGRRQKMAV